MKKIIFVLFVGMGPAVLLAEEPSVPAWAAPALGLPSTDISSHSMPIRSEIEQLWKEKQKGMAQKKLKNWIETEETSPWPWVTKAKLEFEGKRYKKSLVLAQTALKKSPDCGEAYYWRGQSYEAMGKLLDAANEYRAAVIAKEKFGEAQLGLERVQAVLDGSSLTTR